MIKSDLIRTAVGVLLLGSALTTSAEGPPYAGRRLADVLEELAHAGLDLIYSDALVRDDMVVEEEPTSEYPRGILDEILEPFALMAGTAPGGGLVIVPVASRMPSPASEGTVRGVVRVRGAPELLDEVTVSVEETDHSSGISAGGRFAIDGVPCGVHTIVAGSPAVTAERIEGVRVCDGGDTLIRFELAPSAVFLDEVVVTPSHFRILEDRSGSAQYLDRREVEQMPHAADDLYRAVKRLPGTAGGDFTAGFNLRGGEEGELLVLLDGAILYEPFHLKDFQSVFSIVDSEAVGGVELLTGGFPAQFGDRMSGVMNISVLPPANPVSTTVALGTLNSRLLSGGYFNGDRGNWMVSARAWYPGATASLVTGSSEEVQTDYYDVFARIEHRLGSRSTLSGDVLAAYDDLGYRVSDEEEIEQVKARYSSYQAWSNLSTGWSPNLFTNTVVGIARLTRSRTGGIEDIVEGSLAIDDERSFDVIDLRQDWTWAVTPGHVLKWGFGLSLQDADYDYLRVSLDEEGNGDDPVVAKTAPDGTSIGIHVADRFQISDGLILELGVRWDEQSWLDEDQLSPRVSLMWAAGPRTTVRAAWGRYSQAQWLNELQIEDGVTEFSPAQHSVHWLAGVEHEFGRGIRARLEVYDKDVSDPIPRYENLFSPIDLFPEALEDRILVAPDRARMKGIELGVRQRVRTRLSWWLSYVLSSAEDRIDGQWNPRSWDQRHAVAFGLNLELSRGWNLNASGAYHSGWPTTEASAVLEEEDDGELVPELVVGPRNGERLPAYHRLDVRAIKFLAVRRGELKLILEVLNVFSVNNVCCVEDFDFEVENDGTVTAIPQYQYWAPIIPSIGLQYRF